MDLREECDGWIRRSSLIIVWVVCFALLEARNHEGVSLRVHNALEALDQHQPAIMPLVRAGEYQASRGNGRRRCGNA